MPTLRLTPNQRNLYNYYLSHTKRYPNTPCYVPKSSTTKHTLEEYIKMLDKLEALNLIRIDRVTDHYTGWIISSPYRFK